MSTRRLLPWGLLLLVAAVGLAGCEPYMSLTDRIPTQTRQATALLPEAPRFAGMVDLETTTGRLEAWTDMNLREQFREAEGTRLATFLDATGMEPETDLKAVYGAGGRGQSFSAVVFADLTPTQMDQYLDRVPAAGHATTYREVPVYHLVSEGQTDDASAADTLTMGFVRDGVIAAAPDAERVEAMVDRHRDSATGLRGNESYMTLVERVGHGSTAWLVGRDVLQTALRDSAAGQGDAAAETPAPNEAGLQRMLSAWADRTLGIDETPSLEAPDDGRFERLRRQVRGQAVSITLTTESMEGEAYLTMQDETSASNVVDVSKGVMAALRLSGDDTETDDLRGLLDDVSIDRDGPIVHAQFAVGREQFRRTVQAGREAPTARRSVASIRRANRAIRR
ncbi:hypothetical protein [Salinibacter grassmerensis]|uniref:hypothetical protein n=1 Tax=Salinibacter grassmerensis TaxID=3040353 RepID=UPI0021E95223|nr:hypothetical protein [Salinibacter grassmerensis]